MGVLGSTDGKATRLAAVLLLGLLAGECLLVAVRARSAYDEAVYRGISRNILRTGLPYRDSVPRLLFTNSPPLGLYLNAGLMAASGDRLWLTRLLSLGLWGGLLVRLLAALTKRLDGRCDPLLPAGSLALVPILRGELVHVEVDLPLTVLTAAVVLAWIDFAGERAGRRSPARGLWLGLLLGAAGLVKYSALLLGPLLAADCLLGRRDRPAGLGRRLLETGSVALPASLLLLLWYALARTAGTDLLPTFVQLGERAAGRGAHFAPSRMSLAAYAAYDAAALNVFFLLLAGSGVVLGMRGEVRERGHLLRILAAAALVLLVFAAFSAGSRKLRYQDPALPLLALPAAVALARVRWGGRAGWVVPGAALAGAAIVLATRSARLSVSGLAVPVAVPVLTGAGLLLLVARRRGIAGGGALLGVLATLALVLALARSPAVRPPPGPDWRYGRAAGRFVARETPSGAPILASDPVVAYHADRPAHLMTLDRDYGPALRSGSYAAVILAEGWERALPGRGEALASLERRFYLAREDAEGVRVYLPR